MNAWERLHAGVKLIGRNPVQVRMSPEVYVELRAAAGGVNLTDLSYKLGVGQLVLDPVAPVDTLVLRFEVTV